MAAKTRKPSTIYDFWPYNMLIDAYYKPEIACRAYLPAIEPVLETLPDKEGEILLSRYKHGTELRRLGETLHVSSERVRQIQKDGLARLRHPTVSSHILTVGPDEVAALNRRVRELSRAIGEAAPEPDMSDLTADSPIEALNLSARSYNGLRRLRIRMLGDLTATTVQDLMTSRGLGSQSIREIRDAVAPYGIVIPEAKED